MNPVAWCPAAALVLLTAAPSLADEGEGQRPPEVLALHRVDLRPYGGWVAGPHSASGAFIGADIGFRITPVFGLAASGAWFAPFNAGAGSSPSGPVNETQLAVGVDAYVAPWPARANAGGPLGSFEPYVVGGTGFTRTRPIAVVDRQDRTFDYNNLVTFNVGLGVRMFLADRAAIALELRDAIYNDRMESPRVAAGPSVAPGQPGYANSPTNPATWYAIQSVFTNALQIRLGVSFFAF